jgi:nucleoside-diphosphate-sugar epimerase
MSGLTVAVTGPTGTFGFGLIPHLQADDRVERIVGIARRPFDPASRSWSKMVYRQGDVRDPAVLRAAFDGADAVIHLAFLVIGNAPREILQQVNVGGTLNAFEAAAAAGATRFVSASSVAAYGFHRDNPVGMTEDWPVRPAASLFYAKEKAELERRLREAAAEHPDIDLYLVRPSIVLGPHALGAKRVLPGPLDGMVRWLAGLPHRLPMPLPVAVPDFPVQFVHEDDVGQAFHLCAIGAGPPGAYNLAADDTLSTMDIARELGLLPVPVPAGPMRTAARLAAAIPFLPPQAQWVEIASHPAIMDTLKARHQLGWKPHHTALEALRITLGTAHRAS